MLVNITVAGLRWDMGPIYSIIQVCSELNPTDALFKNQLFSRIYMHQFYIGYVYCQLLFVTCCEAVKRTSKYIHALNVLFSRSIYLVVDVC
jgi:hypothetical protein